MSSEVHIHVHTHTPCNCRVALAVNLTLTNSDCDTVALPGNPYSMMMCMHYTHTHTHTHTRTRQNTHTKAGTKVALAVKTNEYSKVHTCYYQCCSCLDWLQNTTKPGLLLYNEYQSCSCCCFYLDQHHWTEKRERSSQQHSLKFSGTHPHYEPHVQIAHVQTLKWA